MSERPEVLLLCRGRERFGAGMREGEGLLFLHLVPGIAGAWTERRGECEHILFGYPENSKEPWFQATAFPASGAHTAATLAIERILFARSLNTIVVADGDLEAIARLGAARHPGVKVIHCGNGDEESLQCAASARKRGATT